MSSIGKKTKPKVNPPIYSPTISSDNMPKDNDNQLGSLSHPDITGIPSELIDFCEDRSNLEGQKMFIFSSSEKVLLSNDKRDAKIDSLFDDSFYIDSESGFDLIPSRYSFYDTFTKSSDRNQRWSKILNDIKSFGFDFPFKDILEYDDLPKNIEITFCNIHDSKFILRISPNFITTITALSNDNDFAHRFFYDSSIVSNILISNSNVQFRRDLLISLLDKI